MDGVVVRQESPSRSGGPEARQSHTVSARRRALIATLVVLAAVAALAVWTVNRDSFSPYLHEVRIEVPGLAHAVSVLQVADLGGEHFGAGQSELAALIEGQRFDAVVLTGDIYGVGGEYSAIWEMASVAKAHSDRVWYLPGNHDNPKVGEGLAERGVPTLPQDGAVPVLDSDPTARDVALVYGRTSASISAAKGLGSKLLVIASHTPPSESRLSAGLALGAGTHLYIAGHTHGGQVRLPLVGALRAPMSWSYEERLPAEGNEIVTFPDLKGRFVDGMYVRDGQRIFVSHGLESVVFGVPRFLNRAEIVVFRFVPAP